MEILLYVLGALALLAGLAGLLLPVLPGAPLLLTGAVLLGWAGDFARVGPRTLGVAAALTLLMLAVDWIAAVLGAKAFGASRWAMAGAVAGALIGLFFGLPGILLGPVVGAVAFELWKDPDVPRAARAGLGVAVGFVVGSAVKMALGLALVGLVLAALAV